MAAFVGLLRAVNVGGTGTLAMADLRALAERAGLERVRTYIASGNLLFESDCAEAELKALLEAALAAHAGRPIAVMLREAAELAAILAANPFPQAQSNRVAVHFLDAPPPEDWRERVKGRADEDYAAGVREIYVHYPSGMGRSRLVIPAAAGGTARSLNTVAKLAELTDAA